MGNKRALAALIAAMSIFGTIGIFRQWIPLPSATVALCRSVIGALFLLGVLLLSRRRADFSALGRVWLPLLLSGICLGANWLLLFEAYRFTTVATATLCYYMAPMLLVLLSPVLLKERLTLRRVLALVLALAGMVPVSGILEGQSDGGNNTLGVLFGLGAAVLYASVVLLNKRITALPAEEKTFCQFTISAVVLLPYMLLTEAPILTPPPVEGVLLLLLVGVVHTGLAYFLYFGAICRLPAQTVAVYSYIDPVFAIVLSSVLTRTMLTVPELVGAAMILGAALISDSKK